MNWLGNVLKRYPSLVAGADDTAPQGGPIQVIVYAHGPVEGIRDCLSALSESFSGRDLLIVQDSKDDATGEYLARFAADHACALIQNLDVLGFRRSVAKAIHVARAEYLAVVDSDVVVTSGGLRELAEELATDPAAELAVGLLDIQLGGRLAASMNGNTELVAAAIEGHGPSTTPDWRLEPFNGHPCFAVRRSTLWKLASWESPRRGESEVDAPHLQVRVVPSCYVSYRNTVIPSTFRPALDALNSNLDPRLLDGVANAILEATRVERVLKEQVLFLLSSPGGTGGAHSVVQEVAGLRRCGFDATIANRVSHWRAFEQHYPEATGFCSYYVDENELAEMADGAAIVVATNHVSVASLKSIVDRNPVVVPFYYVQDYEPWFYSEQDSRHSAAKSSYHLVPNQIAFAKTDWLCDVVHRLAGINVVKVSPGLDRTLCNSLEAKSTETRLSGRAHRVTIAAMIRPNSTRRNSKGTLNVLRQIQRNHARVVDIRVFGCRDDDLDLLEEAAGFRFVNLGELERWEVADVLRGADIFVDLSTYQAFGRTGLEAMSTGCATVLPRGSGVEEYAVHGRNCLLVDSTDDEAAVCAIEKLIADREFMRRIRREALRSGRQYSVARAVWSQLRLFSDSLALNRGSATGRSVVVAR